MPMSALQPGLVSVTFRQRMPPDIIALVARAGLRLIEWGADVHVPPGDVARAREVGTMTREAGLEVAAYGSYYRVGEESPAVAFERVLEAAVALGAPLLRVWAGTRASQDADAGDRERVVSDTRRICGLASAADICIATEFHGGTLADSVPAALSLLTAVDRPNLRTLWQPLGTAGADARHREVEDLRPWLANIHVYFWPEGRHRPLGEGAAEWRGVLSALAAATRPIGLLLEFVQDASPEQFLADASTLRAWIAGDEDAV